jgi:hypothetical protein
MSATMTYAPLTAPRPAHAVVIWRLRDPQAGMTAVCYAWFTRLGRPRWRIEVDGVPVATLARSQCPVATLTIAGDGLRADGWQEVPR